MDTICSEQLVKAIEQGMAAAFERSTAQCIREMNRVFDYYNRRSEARRGEGDYNLCVDEVIAPRGGFCGGRRGGFSKGGGADSDLGAFDTIKVSIYKHFPNHTSVTSNRPLSISVASDEVGGAEFGNGEGAKAVFEVEEKEPEEVKVDAREDEKVIEAAVEQGELDVIDLGDAKSIPQEDSVVESIQVDVAGPGIVVVEEPEENIDKVGVGDLGGRGAACLKNKSKDSEDVGGRMMFLVSKLLEVDGPIDGRWSSDDEQFFHKVVITNPASLDSDDDEDLKFPRVNYPSSQYLVEEDGEDCGDLQRTLGDFHHVGGGEGSDIESFIGSDLDGGWVDCYGSESEYVC